MNRKNLLIKTFFCLMVGICFWITSCSSSVEEKGSVTFSFSDELMNRIMSRAIDDDGETDIPLFEDAVMRYYGTNDKESDTYLLVLNQDNTYFIYSSKIAQELAEKMQEEIASDFSGMEEFENLSEEDIANGNYNEALYAEYLEKIKKYQEMGNNPYAFYENAIISGGSWERIDSVIKLTEKCYYNDTSLDEVSSPKVIATIEQDIDTFIINNSAYGTTMIFSGSIDEGDWGDDIHHTDPHGDDNKESEKIKKLENPKIKIVVTASGKRYEKEIDITYDFTKEEKLIFHKAETRFNNLPLNAKATVTVEFIWNDTTFVKGTRDFVIEHETEVNVLLRFDYHKIPPENYIPEEIDNPDEKPVYYAQCLIPEEYREKFNGGWLYFTANKDKTYNIIANIYDKTGYPSGDKTFAKGTWELIENYDEDILKLTETDYYDFASDKLVNGSGKVTQIDLSKSSFTYNTSAELQLEFKLYASPETYPFTFKVAGYEKNDFTDLGKDVCNVYLYAIKDASVMTSLKSTLSNEKLTDAQKAEVLIPVIEDSLNNTLTVFQPGVIYSSHAGGPTNTILDSGTIQWSGECLTSVKEGRTYGVLATVYFSKTGDKGFYEFGVGLADNLTLSKTTNQIELSIEGMNIPCNINFYYDGNYNLDYTVKTALTDIVLEDESEKLRESVLNEVFGAAEESVSALAKKGYTYNNNLNPSYDIQDGVPFVTLYFEKTSEPIVEEKEFEFEITLNGVPEIEGTDNRNYRIYAVNDEELLAKLRTHFSYGSMSKTQFETLEAQVGLCEQVVNYSITSDPNYNGYSVLSDGTVQFTGIKSTLSYEDGSAGNFVAFVFTPTDDGRTYLCAGFREDISLSKESVNSLSFDMLTSLDASGTGQIGYDNHSVMISMEYDTEALYLNQGAFTFSAKYPTGAALSEADAEAITWNAQLLYKGKNVNEYDPYYEVSDNELLLQKQFPLPSEGTYQIYVTATMPLNESGNLVTSAQTFNVTIPDRHIYDISDDEQPWQYATSLHNVVINGDVTEDDWDWTLSDEGYDHLLQVLFAKHKSTLESLTFNGAFASPAYTQTAESPLYDSNSYSGIQFGRHVSLLFNDVATIGDYLFGSARNIETVKFTTAGSSVGDCCFRDASTLTTLDLTGVTTIGSYAFSATNLKAITIPESVTVIEEGAFVNCNELESAVFEITEGWKYIMNGDTEDANVSSNALSLFNDLNITKLFRE